MTTPPLLGLALAGFILLAPPGRADQEAARGAPPTRRPGRSGLHGRPLARHLGGQPLRGSLDRPRRGLHDGQWRYVSAGRAQIFELLTIAPGETGLELRLRHFDPKLVGREDKQRPVVLKLVRSSNHEALFEGPEYAGSGTVRLTYRLVGEDGLFVILEKGGPKEEFRFRRGDARTP